MVSCLSVYKVSDLRALQSLRFWIRDANIHTQQNTIGFQKGGNLVVCYSTDKDIMLNEISLRKQKKKRKKKLNSKTADRLTGTLGQERRLWR